MSPGRVVRPSPMAEGRAQLKQKSDNRSQHLRDTPAFPIFHDGKIVYVYSSHPACLPVPAGAAPAVVAVHEAGENSGQTRMEVLPKPGETPA